MDEVMELAEKPSTELTVQDRAALALASSKTRQDLMVMATKSAHLIEIKNKAARDEIHSAAMVLAGARIAISKTSKAAREDATKFSKAVIAEEASLIAITEPEEKRLLTLRDAWDEVVAAEKAAKEAAERARILALTGRIGLIREFVALAAASRTAARVDDLLTKLSLTSLADFEEFGDEAAAAHLDAMQKVTAILTDKQAQEAEQARIKQEQADAAEKLASERAAFEAAQAAAKVEAERVAKELAAQQAAAKAEADRIASEHAAQVAADKAAADATVARLAEETAKQQAALKAQQEAAFAELNATAARIMAERKKQEADAEAARQVLADERAAFQAQVAEANRVAEQAAITQAAIDQARQAKTAPAELLDQLSETIAFIASPDLATDPAEQEQVAIKDIAPEIIEVTAPVWEPTDSEVMWEAIKAVATAYDWTTEQATTRLQAVQWTI